MKLSVAWIFDHIDADRRSVDITDMVLTFNRTTAEIEGFERLSIDTHALALVQVISISCR